MQKFELMNENLSSMCHESTVIVDQMVIVDQDVKIRLISFYCQQKNSLPPIIFLGGLSTVIESFSEVIVELTKDFTFHYIETRDHSSSEMNGNLKYDMQTMGQDLCEVIKFLNLTDNQFILLGYSLGVAVIAEGLQLMKVQPLKFIFLEPTPVFHYPKWTIPIIKISLLMKTSKLRCLFELK